MRERLRIAVVASVVLACALTASFASAELTARGDLFVKFSGGIEPRALPRKARAPISLRIAGAVRSLSGQRPPALRRIAIAINRGGRLDAKGLPVCSRDEIQPSTSIQALAICGDALVGGGSYAADVAFPDQGAFESHGRILAFNAVVDGHRAVLAQLYSEQPVAISMILVFHIRQESGAFGTVLTGAIPESVIRWGYLKRISIELHRNFVYRGRARSYLSAACGAPPGFPGAIFPFARAAMSFEDGRTLSSTLTRSCRVRSG